MCGIVGFLGKNIRHSFDDILHNMLGLLVHRGPDADGVWIDHGSGIALGHRRLSILDLSQTGRQPMQSSSGRYVIVFNGEIYNHQEIRNDVESFSGETRIAWSGHSDTEVLLAAVETWGIEEALERFVGMFAFALWDCRERMLYLVRDRLGEKPLYYGWIGDTLVFASELKAMRAYPGWRSEIDTDALTLFLRHNYIPAPYSIWRQIKKPLPGNIVKISNYQLHSIQPYWSAREIAEAGKQDPFMGTEKEAIDHLQSLLEDSIALQMVADVPVGALLSGGVDSSLVAASMQATSATPVKTFTVGFGEKEFNEAVFARAVAKHLGTEHTELYVTPKDALAVIPMLPTIYDEPFADVSQIPTFLICQLSKRCVTVSLSGDGGDELFGGYTRYILTKKIWHVLDKITRLGRKSVSVGMMSIPVEMYNLLFRWLDPYFLKYGEKSSPGDKLHKFAESISVDSMGALYLNLLSHWKNPTDIVKDSREREPIFRPFEKMAALPDDFERMMYIDMVSYLPDDILVKVDRAAMAVSLETRVPLLDHRIVEFAWRLPLSLKIRNGEGKWILKQLLYRHVPKNIVERPKKGFFVPIGDWLRGPLREWAESLLSKERLREEGFFRCEPILKKWEEHLSGKRNWQFHLWDILMFQAWWSEHK